MCFDEEFARIRGVSTRFYYTLLLCLTALTIVTLIYVVGIVLVIALLTLPVAVAGHFSRKLWQMMLLSALLSAIFTTTGLAVSYGIIEKHGGSINFDTELGEGTEFRVTIPVLKKAPDHVNRQSNRPARG